MTSLSLCRKLKVMVERYAGAFKFQKLVGHQSDRRAVSESPQFQEYKTRVGFFLQILI